MSVGFVGMGNMGQMLVTALVRAGALRPEQAVISNRSPEKSDRIAAALPGVQKAINNGDLARQSKSIFLCIKPGETKAVLDEMRPYISDEHLLVIINNTISIAMLEDRSQARVAKVIPSVVQTVGKGASLLMFGERCIHEDKALLVRLMSAISQPHVIAESDARIASDLTSCGPAFISYAFRAMAEAARHYAPGLTRAEADAMIRETAKATFELMERTGYTFDDIINRVSTPGGVTADGIKVMDELFHGLWEQVLETTIVREDAKRAKVQL